MALLAGGGPYLQPDQSAPRSYGTFFVQGGGSSILYVIRWAGSLFLQSLAMMTDATVDKQSDPTVEGAADLTSK